MFRRTLIILLLIIPALAFAANPNIVLITLDSARADRMGFLGAKRPTINLDVLARQSVIFDRAYAQAPLTVVSHASILTGTYPQTHKVTEFGSPLASSLPYLPALLRDRGYRTAAFVGSIALDPKNGLAPGFARGFDMYDAGFHQPQKGENRFQSVDRQGGQVVARAIAWLTRNSKGPFFLWVHLNDAHAPYSSYDSALAAADVAAGKLVAFLKTQKLYDDAAILVAADHGESLGAHGEDTHGIFLYDEAIRVPLLVKLPQNQQANKHVSARVRLVDLAPTALEIAGVPVPSQMEGQSLLRIAKTNADQPVYSQSDFTQRGFGWSALESWRASKYLYIRAPKPELYDAASDAAAAKNLAGSSKATLDTIAGQLDAFDRRFTAAGKSGPDLSSSEMQKLASLGYVGIQKSSGPGTAATGTDPKDVISTANKVQAAMLTLDDGDPAKTIVALQPVISSQPNLYLAQYGLGVALAQQQQFAQAVEHLHKAIELQPDSSWAHYWMGSSLLKTGDFKTAAVHLEIATSRLPDCSTAHLRLAEAYEHLGKASEAKRERAKAAAIRK